MLTGVDALLAVLPDGGLGWCSQGWPGGLVVAAAVQVRVPAPSFVTVRLWAAGAVPPSPTVKLSCLGDTSRTGPTGTIQVPRPCVQATSWLWLAVSLTALTLTCGSPLPTVCQVPVAAGPLQV